MVAGVWSRRKQSENRNWKEGAIVMMLFEDFFFQAEDGIRDLVRSRGLGDVYKRQHIIIFFFINNILCILFQASSFLGLHKIFHSAGTSQSGGNLERKIRM
mgnify:CR=1 FL=1